MIFKQLRLEYRNTSNYLFLMFTPNIDNFFTTQGVNNVSISKSDVIYFEGIFLNFVDQILIQI